MVVESSERLHIALVTPGFSIDSDDWAIPFLQDFASNLAKNHDVHVFSLRYPAAGVYSSLGLTHHATGGGMASGLSSFAIWQRAFRAILRQHRATPFDLVHAFWGDESGFVGSMAARWINKPSLVSLIGGELVYLADIDYGTQGSWLRRRIVRMALKRATLVSVASRFQKNLAELHGVSPEKIGLIPLGVDRSRFRPGDATHWDEPSIMQAASLVPVKDQALLLEVFQHVLAKRADVRLFIAGGGLLEQDLRQMAADLKVQSMITWLGARDHGDMPEIYRRASVYLQTSRHESLGISVLESLACGTPVLGTPVGILPEVACRPASNDKVELAEQLLDVLGNRAKYADLRSSALNLAEEKVDLNSCTERFEETYRRLIANAKVSQ